MAYQEFLVRFYEWSLADALREVEIGFPLISRIHGVHGRRFVSALEGVPREAREELLRLMVRRFHPVAMELLGTPLTDGDLEVLEEFLMKRMSNWQSSAAKGIKGRRLRSLLQSVPPYKSDSVMRPSDLGPSFLDFQIDIGPWTVFTYVECGRYPNYHHLVRSPQEYLQSQISVQSWMGIASVTEWDLAEPGDEESIVATMKEAFGRFLDAVPSLLDRLEPGA